MQNLEAYLQATYFIDSDNPAIQKKAEEICPPDANLKEKAVKLFYFVRDQIKYNMYAVSTKKEGYKASAILQAGQGWCLQKAILLAALARAAGLPCRLVVVSLRNHRASDAAIEAMGTNYIFPHVYNEVLVDGKWIKIAATFDKEICARNGVPTVEFDGENNSILSSVDLEGNPYIEYLDDYGVYADVPWDFIVENNKKVYGERHKFWFE